MKKILIAGFVMMLAACGNKEKEYDATGIFEATETTVSAEQSGTLVHFDVTEGDEIALGQEVGLVDTTQLWLKIQQAGATKAVYQSQKPDVEKQIAATRQQLAKARREEQRYRELVSDGAAPSKMLDDATSQVQVLERQLSAMVSSLTTSTQALSRQMEATDVQVNQLRDQLDKCHVRTPVKGTVLEKYVEQGEFVSTGKPLLKVADTRRMFLRAYVTTSQLRQIRVGQQVKVLADYGRGERRTYEGRVSWISSRSEFTPKTILTDDERADQVYAVKIAVGPSDSDGAQGGHDGYLKIGMYGEVKF